MWLVVKPREYRVVTYVRTDAVDATTPAPPRWARVAAHAAALTPLPSSLWRLLLVFGFPAGYTAQGYEDLGTTGWGAVYLVMLSLGTEGAALLTLGLVQRWGEVVPSWIPFIGGREVPVKAAVVPAAIGAVLLVVLWTPLLGWWHIPHDDLTPLGVTLIGLLYLPMVLWGPLLALVTVSYSRRRRHVSPTRSAASASRR